MDIDFSKVISVGLNTDRLPPEYKEVQYIRSYLPDDQKSDSNRIYVDTQVKNINGSRVKFNFNKVANDQIVYGVRTGWNGPWFCCALSSEAQVKFLVMPDRVNEFEADLNVHYVDNNCRRLGYYYIDDVEYKYSDNPPNPSWGKFATGYSLWLFNDHSIPGGNYSAMATIYSAEFYQDQKLVCYPVPCREVSGSKRAGFYDLVNSRFITAGTDCNGWLKAGPDVNTEVIQIKTEDGTVLWNKPSV